MLQFEIEFIFYPKEMFLYKGDFMYGKPLGETTKKVPGIKIKAVFFDFGDVLVSYNHMRGCEALALFSTKTASQIYDLIFGSRLEENKYNRGEFTDMEWYDMCVKLLDLSNCPYLVFSEKWGDIFSPNPNIQYVLSKIRPRVSKFVLSNTNGLHWKWAQENLSVLTEHFQSPYNAILSSEEKSRKPERLIFQRALERAEITAEEALFIDDKLVNVEAFEELGGHGIVYNAHSSNILDLEKSLRKYNCI